MHLLIPVKRFELAKTRLEGTLCRQSRGDLMRAMLRDLLEQVDAVRGIDQVVLLSNEPDLSLWSRQFRLRHLRESAGSAGLNAGLTVALAELLQEGVRRVLILHADLPLARASDLQRLVDDDAKRMQDDIVLVPDRARRGTNAMLASLPLPIDLCYGAGSFDMHLQKAAACGLPVTIAQTPSIAYDVDVRQDIVELLTVRRVVGMGPARHTLRALQGSIGAECCISPDDPVAPPLRETSPGTESGCNPSTV
jgi:2-phospho-L-lactate/phosphoenolpyruvate guanylyltransferase